MFWEEYENNIKVVFYRFIPILFSIVDICMFGENVCLKKKQQKTKNKKKKKKKKKNNKKTF